MKHLFFIDPIEKLNIKKDSSLMMALTFKQLGHDVLMLFENDFYLTNETKNLTYKAYEFDGAFKKDGCYLEKFALTKPIFVELNKEIIIHMRIDPPFDTKYLRYLWMLDFLRQTRAVRVHNDPVGILKYNEKLLAFKEQGSLASFIGSSAECLKSYQKDHQNIEEWIVKPLDLYSGIGVQKCTTAELLKCFQESVQSFHGAVVVQPFQKEVYHGELRSIYFQGQELGSIIKVPPKDSYLSNIAQGASFSAHTLESNLKKKLDIQAQKLMAEGLDLLAFDILGDNVTEVNTTCPGLLVEVSFAFQRNLCREIVDGWAE